MNKQIEEMARIMHNGELARNRGDLDCTEFPTDLVVQVGLQRLAGAKALCNEGYRKASDVAREIFEEIADKLRGLFDFFRQDDDIREAGAIMVAISEIAEFKKKYESEGADE